MEAARIGEGLTVKQAMKLLGLSRTSYYRQVRGMKDYRKRPREVQSAKHAEVLREVAIKRVEAGHRRVRVYALAWSKITADAGGRQSHGQVPRRSQVTTSVQDLPGYPGKHSATVNDINGHETQRHTEK